MNRFMATCLIATVATFSLAACSGSPSDATTPMDSADTSTSAAPTTAAPTTPAEETMIEQSVSDACLSMAGPMAEANTALEEIASVDTDDPQKAVDAWTTLVDAFRSVSETVTNPEVKDSATVVYQDLTAVRDAMQKIYVDEDMSVMSEFTTATTDWQASQTELFTLCAG